MFGKYIVFPKNLKREKILLDVTCKTSIGAMFFLFWFWILIAELDELD